MPTGGRGDDPECDPLALREENAREREAHLHWKAEAHRLQEENADLRTEMDVRRIASKATIDQLGAHVAALVKALDTAEDYLDHGASCVADCKDASGDNYPCTCGVEDVRTRVRILLDPNLSPDLAALAAEAQAREAVIEAARAWARHAHLYVRGSITDGELGSLQEILRTLAALDAARED